MLDWLISKLRPKIDAQWYGTVVIRFEAGHIVHLEETRSFKPPPDPAIARRTRRSRDRPLADGGRVITADGR